MASFLFQVQLNNQYLVGKKDVIEKGEPLGKIVDTVRRHFFVLSNYNKILERNLLSPARFEH